jgi:YidC/Oxa1 family membrane protein insertase
MNNQKFFLILAISLSIFLLWDKWQIAHTLDENGKPITFQVKQNTIHNNADVPSAPTKATQTDVPSGQATSQFDTPNARINQSDFITIQTDLLSLEISNKGGTIQSAWLNNYPLELDSQEKFQLLSNEAGSFFQMQSGLFPEAKLPTHNSKFNTKQKHYQMTDDTLIVPMIWQKNGVSVIKNFYFKKGSYVVGVDYQIQNNSNVAINAGSYARLTRTKLDESNMMMPTFSGGAQFNSVESVYEKIEFDDFATSQKSTTKGGWTAMIQHYFFAAIIPNKDETHTYSSSVLGDKYRLTAVNPVNKIAQHGKFQTQINQFYIGPKEQAQIDSVAPGLDKTVDYGILFIIAKPLSNVLHWINTYVGSWGYSIILLTLLIKLAFYKLSEKSYRSMAGMRKLAPRLEQLKKTYGDDRQKMGQKTMELYKKEKINPASGCLPIVVQIPVFISLYWVLLEAVELRQTPFWYLNDLSAQDPYFILPIVMGVSMFIQQKLNPAPSDPMQAKIMMALPPIFTIFFLWFPSGLVLYWVVNNTLSIAQQWVINKRING